MVYQGKRIKVLHMTPLGAGGISTLTVAINSKINLDKIKFDYLVFKDEHTFYEDVVRQYGAEKRIVNVSSYRNKLILYWKKYVLTKKMLKRYTYDVMHVDASTPLDVVIGLAAKHAGIKRIILHSHIAGDNKKSIMRPIYMAFCKWLMRYVFTDYVAISDASAEFMFPAKILKRKEYIIVKNGIIADKYAFDETKRAEVRRRLKIEDCFVIGHIGRFSKEKNHIFLIELLPELIKKNNKAVLLLVGDGPLRKEMESKVKESKLDDHVIFYGVTHEVPEVLMGMDAFVFPSEYEGLGIAAVEAQCAGLPTYCSEGIPEETNITPLFHRINGYNISDWVANISEPDRNVRHDYVNAMKEAGFDIGQVALELEDFYISPGKTCQIVKE